MTTKPSPMCTVASLAGMFLCSGLSAQSHSDKIERTHQVFAKWAQTTSPGCAVGVVQDGDGIFEQGYGSANLDFGIPLSSQSVFYIASTSKQFAAAAVGLLVVRGELSLDDEVSKHVPEFPTYEQPVTIRHLVHHTSGVRDYLGLRAIAGKDFEDFFDMRWAVDLISRQESLNFEPGSEFLYSNSGYLLLAEIVERVTGTSLAEFGQENFFTPLGMDATHWGSDRHRVVPDRVTSYDARADGTYRRYVKNFHAMGDGNLLTSVQDLIKWDGMFYDTTDAWRPLVDLMHTQGVLNNGDTIDYAFGLFAGEYRGRRTIRHGGSFLGFRTELLRFPDDHVSTIVLCSFGAADPTTYAQRLADIWLFDDVPVAEEGVSASEPAEPRIELPTALLEEFVGRYTSAESPVGDVLVVLLGGSLNLEAGGAAFELEPTAPDRFRSISGPAQIGVVFETDGGPSILRVSLAGSEDIVLSLADTERGSPADTEGDSPPQVETFAGSYFSRELDATYVMSAHDGELLVTVEGGAARALRSVTGDEFAMAGWTLRFTRDAAGIVDGFLLDAGRVRALRFAKQ